MIQPKSQGTTPSERLLAKICETTFLKLWSYPNVFRDQAQSHGKEICDLLVVFGRDIIIFSDKSCRMPNTGDLDLDWARWFKRAILKSATQIFGAERWLRENPHRLFIDSGCKQPLPFPLPPSHSWRIHRVVVATGARNRCKSALGGSGSLQIRPDIIGGDHFVHFSRDGLKQSAPQYKPFAVGQVDQKRGYVHVFDEAALLTVLRELDTVSDFIAYLTEKEALIESGNLMFAAGEEELLWKYLASRSPLGDQPFDEGIPFSLSAGNWEAWESSPAREIKRRAEEPSRAFWDKLIDTFTEQALDGKLLSGSSSQIREVEICLRIMASEDRLTRRGITTAFIPRAIEAAENIRTWRMLRSSNNPYTGYVFLFYKRLDDCDFETYREERKAWLSGLVLIHAEHNPHIRQLVGITTEPENDDGHRSWDILLCIPPKRDDRSLGKIRDLQQLLGVKDEDINAKFLMELEFLPGAGRKIEE